MIPFYRYKFYFIAFFVSLIIGFIYAASFEKSHLLFYFADNRSAMWNYFFIYITRVSEWIGYLIFTIILLFVHYGKTMFLMVNALLSGIAALSLKWFFSRPRPAIELHEQNLMEAFIQVHDIALHTGLTSFPSGHALAGFALCTYLALISKPRVITLFAFLMLAWAIGLSRVYLGHHFFEDIVAGAITGFLVGLCAGILYRKYGTSYNKNLRYLFA